jgi:hypothetical protein
VGNGLDHHLPLGGDAVSALPQPFDQRMAMGHCKTFLLQIFAKT